MNKYIEPLFIPGILFIAFGVFGVWFQGDFWGSPVYGNYNKGTVIAAFYLPSFLISFGLFLCSLSSVNSEKPYRKLSIVFISTLLSIIIAAYMAGDLAFELAEKHF
ncbi:MAG: hypothetical protein NE327_00450 [Lentisphaeraceae bacterium]|nr:hypothetical protein [Lentisphaeraceae bacterium]